MTTENRLQKQSVSKSFFQYLIPSLIGMALLSVNIIIDGIFVGHGVGSVALAAVNVASPVFSIFLSIALLIGIGGGAVYSMMLGKNEVHQAQRIFTTAMALVTVITFVISIISYLFMEQLAFFFGANEETLPFVVEYIRILLIFSLFVVWESALSVFVRNDGNPNLAMLGLGATSLLNIALNYWMIFILKLGVTGAALATVLSIVVGLLILMTHFLKKTSHLKLVKIRFTFSEGKQIIYIGFPSFLSEVGFGVFVIGYNIVIAYHASTNGLAAFSVINYLHTFMFLMFMGIGSAIQPLVSYYYGANLFVKIKQLVKLAERTAVFLGGICLLGGYFGAMYLVSLFGITSQEITDLAIQGIRLFFISYLFMGINFIYVTYFQSIGYVKPALWITICRSFLVFGLLLVVLPFFFGTPGVWLVLPGTEAIITLVLVLFARKGVVGKLADVQELNA